MLRRENRFKKKLNINSTASRIRCKRVTRSSRWVQFR